MCNPNIYASFATLHVLVTIHSSISQSCFPHQRVKQIELGVSTAAFLNVHGGDVHHGKAIGPI